MRYWVCNTTGAIDLASMPTPALMPGDVLLRLRACGVCGTDLMKIFTPSVAKPVGIGHEVVGVVEAIGPGVTTWRPGMRVAVAHHAPDPASHYTRRGSGPMDPQFKATNIEPGGFAELIRVPAVLAAQTMVPVPAHVSDLRAVFMEPLACCLRALDRVPVLEGDVVLVVGAGAVGMLFVPLLRDRSATVIAADIRPAPLEQAAAWGAATVLLEGDPTAAVATARAQSQGRGADMVILTALTPQTLALAQRAVRDGGTILLFGAKPASVIAVDMWDVWRRELNFVSSYSSTPDLLPRAMAFLAGGRRPLEKLVSHALSFDNADDAIGVAQQGQAMKAVVMLD
jgi:L-iditol 2-dehydrogenase